MSSFLSIIFSMLIASLFFMASVCTNIVCAEELHDDYYVLEPSEYRGVDGFGYAIDKSGALTSESRLYVKNGYIYNGLGFRVRLFGTNISYDAAFPNKELAVTIADQLKNLGFNAVRFHHIDGNTAPRGLLAQEGDGYFDKQQLDKLDYFIYCLKQKGIYSVISGHVSRTYKSLQSVDTKNLFKYGKGLVYFSDQLAEDQINFAVALLEHVNPYTGKSYVDESAIAFFELSNEDSLVDFAFSNWNKVDEILWHELRNAWERVERPDGLVINGDSPFPTRRSSDDEKLLWVRFLSDLEIKHAMRYKEVIRSTGYRGMIISSQANFAGGAGLVRENAVSDIIDVHQYFDPPGLQDNFIDDDPRLGVKNRSIASEDGIRLLRRMSHFRVLGKPFIVTEYDHPAPAYSSYDYIILLAAFARQQDWDGIFHFDFASHIEDYKAVHINGPFHMASNAGKLIVAPVAAMIFREGLIKHLNKVVTINVEKDELFKAFVKGDKRGVDKVWKQKILLNDFAEFGIKVQMNILDGSTGYVENKNDYRRMGKSSIDVSQTNRGYAVVESEYITVVTGEFLKPTRIPLNNSDVFIQDANDKFATIIVMAMDGNSINISRMIRIILLGAVLNSRMIMGNAIMSSDNIGSGYSTVMKKVAAQISVKAENLDGLSEWICTDTVTSNTFRPVASEDGEFMVDSKGRGYIIDCRR